VMLPTLSGAGVIFRAALSETAKETAMALSRIIAPRPAIAAARFTPFGPAPHPPLKAILTGRTCFCRMRKSSMFADVPLDNRTVDRCAAVAAIRPSQAVLKPHRVRNDLIFRRGRSFCNIELKIRQYG